MQTVAIFSPDLLRGIPPGTWIAISPAQDRVLAAGITLAEVVETVRKQKEEHPYFLRVPAENSGLIV